MPEQTKNAAVSGEWKLVPVAQLKKWRRDLDACQKVMWLRGGFDPAYCMDAQDCLKEMEGVLAAPVSPAGGEVGIIQCWACRSEFALEAMESNDGCCPACDSEIDLGGYVCRLQAENAALQQRLNTADQRVDDMQTALQAAQTPFPGYPDRHPDEVVKS